jgi:hypothetical protein
MKTHTLLLNTAEVKLIQEALLDCVNEWEGWGELTDENNKSARAKHLNSLANKICETLGQKWYSPTN